MMTKEHFTAAPLVDADDAPKWTEKVFERAEIRRGDEIIREATGTLTKRGRPKSENPKVHVNLRLDRKVIEHFREGGPGWQSRINETLLEAVEKPRA